MTYLTAISVFVAISMACAEGELRCIQQPTFWIVGQQTRIMIQTPEDCGKLEVTHPDGLELFDRWPYKAGDTTQRFYFRAQKPLEAGEIRFKSGGYELSLPVRVLSWEQALTDEFESGGFKLPRVFPLEGKDEHRSGLSFLTQEYVDRFRRSGIGGAGGEEVVSKRLAEAEDMEKVFYALPETTVPRSVYVNRYPMTGCPICGKKVFEGRSGFYPWTLDYENHPYQLQCPECGRWFPTNDFASGDMASGEFPDDGWCYFADDGTPYGFVAYYCCWYYMNRFRNLPYVYANMYACTGDRRLGRAAALTLFRLAEQYLNLALNVNQRKAYTREALWRGGIVPQGTPAVDGGWYYVEGNWEVPLVGLYAPAFEWIWDYFDEDDPELIHFLQQHHHPEIKTMQDVRQFIETGYFRVVAQGCLDRTIVGNHPQGQRAAMELALVLNSSRSHEIVDWTFNGAGGMRYFLTNEFFIDGSAFEAPGYNRGHYINTQEIADLMDRIRGMRPDDYEHAGFPLLADDPKYKYMYDFNINYSLIGRTCAHVGDSGDVAPTEPWPLHPCSTLSRQDYIKPFQKCPDNVNFARVLWDPETNQPIKQLADEKLRAKVTELVEKHGAELDLPSNVLDGYKHVILRSGEGEDKRALWMRYGQAFGHVHYDQLSIGYEALKRTLLPELGYYRGEDYRTEWDMNWCIHYNARIVGEDVKPATRGNGALKMFADGGWAKMATAMDRKHVVVDPPQLYQMLPEQIRERTIALVDISPQHSYAVSIFQLHGGTDHYWSFHGPRGTAECSGLKLTAQNGGTLAGPDIPYGIKWDSEWSKANWEIMCFPFLYDVYRGTAEGIWSMDWTLENYPDVHMRMHAIQPSGADVGLAKGKPPGGGKPYELQWAVQHTRGEFPLSSCFATVIEAYEGEPLITDVQHLNVSTQVAGQHSPVAFRITCGDRVDTIIYCRDPDGPVTTGNGITMQGSLGIWAEVGNQVKGVFLANGTRIAKGEKQYTLPTAAWSGQIVSADFTERKLVVAPPHPQPEALVGRYAHITNEQGNDVTHLIVGAQTVAEGTELTLELDPRIGEGPVVEIHEDGITSGMQLVFGGYLYYHGKTLSNEDASALYKINGVRSSRAYINTQVHPDAGKEKLGIEFTDRENDGNVRFTIYDYGPGDAVTVPNFISVGNASGG